MVAEREREREKFVWRKGSESRKEKERRGRKGEKENNESKYNVKGYLIVSTLYPRPRPGRDYTATSLLPTVASFIRNPRSTSSVPDSFRL